MLKKRMISITSVMICLILISGCGLNAGTGTGKSVYIDEVAMEEVTLEDEAVALAGAPALSAVPAAKETQMESVIISAPEPAGVLTAQNGKAVIDYSNTADGYVMVQYTAKTSQRLKAQVKGPAVTYTYNLPAQTWITFPLSDGNGNYQMTIYENVVDNRYAAVISAAVTVKLKDEFAPFIRPNQYVDYSAAENTVAKAAELTEGIADPLKKVEVVYDYVVKKLTYDYDKAATVKSGYLPVLDEVLESKKGICFDYAALMAGMLRSQGVPCKLVVGYAGTMYHAWISVWTEETGWVDGVIYFDGRSWHRMDPTFASTGQQSAEIMDFIGNEANYTTKYLY